MNQKQFDRWKNLREKGKDNFVWMTGVLAWGLTTGLLYAVVMYLIDHDQKLSSLFSFSFVSYLSFSLLFFAIGGYFWGRVVWQATEKKFKAEQENRAK